MDRPISPFLPPQPGRGGGDLQRGRLEPRHQTLYVFRLLLVDLKDDRLALWPATDQGVGVWQVAAADELDAHGGAADDVVASVLVVHKVIVAIPRHQMGSAFVFLLQAFDILGLFLDDLEDNGSAVRAGADERTGIGQRAASRELPGHLGAADDVVPAVMLVDVESFADLIHQRGHAFHRGRLFGLGHGLARGGLLLRCAAQQGQNGDADRQSFEMPHRSCSLLVNITLPPAFSAPMAKPAQ